MHPHGVQWEWIVFGLIKLLKAFGLIPGAVAGYGVKKLYQKWRQNRAMNGWPSTEATIQNGHVQKHGYWSYWAEITYTYYVDEYRLGKHVHRFRREADADDFVRQLKGRHVQVHYDRETPDNSVILDRDLEMVALLMPQRG